MKEILSAWLASAWSICDKEGDDDGDDEDMEFPDCTSRECLIVGVLYRRGIGFQAFFWVNIAVLW